MSLDDDVKRSQPRFISYPELAVKMHPYIQSYPWAQQTLKDMWLTGAPVPQDYCPGKVPCENHPFCTHQRRIIHPNQFRKWWEDVRERASVEISVNAALNKMGGEAY